MNEVFDVVIPYRSTGDPRRDVIIDWVLHRYAVLLPEARVIVRDDGGQGAFNRSRARNRGIAEARHDVVMVADADTIFFARKVRRAVKMAKGERTWIFPFMTYYNADEAWTKRALARSPAWDPDEGEITYDHRLGTTEAGLIVVPMAALDTIGGWDERFECWGYEDRAVTMALDTLWASHQRLPGFVVHLNHEALRFDSPGIERNQALHLRYQRARGRPDDMRQLLTEGVPE